MKHIRICRASIITMVLAAAAAYTPVLSTAGDTNHVETSLSETNQFEHWQQLSTDTVKALRANQLADAIRLCNEALTLSATFDPTNTCFSRSQVLRAEVYMWENKRPQAAQLFQDAVASCEKAAGTNSPELVYPLSSQANFYYFVDRHPDRVVAIFERVLDILQHAPGTPVRDLIMWSRNLAKIYTETKQYAKAEPLFKRAIELCEKADAEWLPYELLNAADFYRDWGKVDQAEALGQRALGIREKAAATGDANAQGELTTCLASLGATYLAAHKPDKAEASFRRGLQILDKLVPPTQPDLIPYLLGLAEALQAEKKYSEAETLYQRAISNARMNLSPEDTGMADLLEKYAVLLKDMDKGADAEKVLAQAKTIRNRPVTDPVAR